MSRPVIKVEHLSKRYRLGLKETQAETLAGQIVSLIKSPWQNLKRLREMSRFGVEDASVFWALKDINFEVNEGEVLGIIGKNGAGKSTLLKILSQITEPTSGKIEIRGRVASLLEVGTGFHPELSGRENIYMNGTILGMTRREIDSKLDEIIEFSGVEKFIDTAVKFYSSGMKVRLGFSVAAHLEPEILIIDEVLAVGDFEFQKKCLGKMEDVAGQGRTVIFVSHDLNAIRSLCSRTLIVNNGVISFIGKTENSIDFYLNSNSQCVFTPEFNQQAWVKEVRIYNSSDELTSEIKCNSTWKVELIISIESEIDNFVSAIGIIGPNNESVITNWQDSLNVSKGEYLASFENNDLVFSEGEFKLSIGLSSNQSVIQYLDKVISINFYQSDGDGFSPFKKIKFGLLSNEFVKQTRKIDLK
ncbi:ABC transporter ATP-binding protein [Algoriphagus aquimarinus]|uniref:Lipopolysaccharide transport system ATP-binding protein n=1 Tax=Algoriphagus aquimarinus TaxID=237018 RepID=A0A1I1CBW9_9BACT|nr:polysaccharide ABC transporter ATP-binding protein [Algoriphagus aquimarinus]SFB60074.1 lipopolysaccharide transport system ATP-binding protein [Algoriphagus aquimarinus]